MEQQSCPRIPRSKALKAIRKTEQTGNEHGFVVCADGSTGPIVSGGKTGMSLNVREVCDDKTPVSIVHTHPNGVLQLSDQDRRVLDSQGVQTVCVGNADGDDPGMVCKRMKPDCKVSFDE
jgi:hypothetical protein